MEYLKIGTINKTFGIKGELRIYSTTDFGNERYKKGNEIFVLKNGEYLTFTAKNYRKNGIFDIVSFNEINTIEEAESILKCDVFILKEKAKLPTGFYHHSDLIGCNIIDQNSNVIGTVTEVADNPANKNLKCVTKEGKNFTIPFVKSFVKNVDIEKKQIKVEIIPGIL